MQRMRIIRGDFLVFAGDLERFAFTARDIVGMNEIVHRAGVIWILLVNTEENFRRAIGMFSGNSIGWSRGEMRQGVESACLWIVRERFVNLFHGLFPSPNA